MDDRRPSVVERVAARYAALKNVLPFTWHRDVARFDVEGAGFDVEFKARHITHPKYGGIMGFQVAFYKRADKDAPWQYKPTGEGNALPIFATVGAIVRDFLVRRKPQYVWFVADEPSRVRLYNRLIQKLVVPGYDAEVTADGKYTLRRTKSVFE